MNDAPLREILRTLQVYPGNHGLDAYQSTFFSERLQSARVDSCYLLMMFFQPYWLRQRSVKVKTRLFLQLEKSTIEANQSI